MLRLSRYLLLAMVVIIAGCDSTQFDPGTVYLRVLNSSTVDFTSVYVASGGTADYGAVRAGRYSEFHAMEMAYRYGYVEAKVGNNQFVIQPIDYVGEDALMPGKYTYVLTLVDDRLDLSLQSE